jgi:hypothetical protein
MIRILMAAGLVVVAGAAWAAPKPKPAATVSITNARDVTATEVSIEAAEGTVRLAKPLAARARTSLKLPRMTGCNVAIAAIFEDESVVEIEEFDICKDSRIRFTD